MARPLSVVFQELAAPDATTTTPQLDSVIIGPAYALFDYPSDAASIELSSTYGVANGSAGNGGSIDPMAPPAAGSDAVTVLDGAYPQQPAGSVVDHASVAVYLKYPRVLLGSTQASVGQQLGTSIKTDPSDPTLIELVGMIGTGFVGAGIRPGDRITLTSSGPTEQTVVRTVASVGEPNSDGLVPPGNEKYLRLSQSLPSSGPGPDEWTYAASGAHIRIERELGIQRLEDPTGNYITFPEPGSDKLVIKGGAMLPVQLQPAATVAVPNPPVVTVQRPLTYSRIYLSYRALRQDLQRLQRFDKSSIVTINGQPHINGLGKIDARNPMAVAIYCALQNSGTAPVYGYCVASDDAAGHLAARDALSSRDDLWAFVPLTQDINIIAAYRNENVDMADPTVALATGVEQRWRMVIGSVPLPQSSIVYSGSISGVAQQPSGASTGLYRTLVLDAASTDPIDGSSILPGDSVTIGLVPPNIPAWESRRGTHLVGHVNSSKNFPNPGDPTSIELVPSSSRWSNTPALSGEIEILVRAPDGTVKLSSLARVVVSQNTSQVRFSMLAPTVVGGPYTISYRIVPGLPNVSVSITGFSIVVSVNGTTHTANDIVTAVNAHPTVSSILTASVIANGAAVINGLVPNTDPVVGSNGSTAAVSAVVGGVATITGLSGMSLSSVGRYLTLSGAANSDNNGTFQIIEFIDPTSVKIANASAVAPDANNGAINWTERYNYQRIVPEPGACIASIVLNDALYNRLEDNTAQFLTAGVKAGDTLVIPIDPNNYSNNAFTGRTLQYKIASVLSETRLLIANGLDDTDSAANELPHGFARDIPNRYIDNVPPAAIAYRIERQLSKDDQILALATISQSVASKRCTLVWPNLVKVAGLTENGAPAGWVPSYYLAAAVAGACAGLPAQHGLTNLGFAGIAELKHATDYFRERQLVQISDAGYFVVMQSIPGALPVCIHQLTTDPTTLNSGEFSIVKNTDYVSRFFRDIARPFLGVYNVTPATINALSMAILEGRDALISQTIDRVGPPLLSGELTSISVSPFDASRVEIYFDGDIAVPFNTAAFHLVL
jgi:hypothetical protein